MRNVTLTHVKYTLFALLFILLVGGVAYLSELEPAAAPVRHTDTVQTDIAREEKETTATISAPPTTSTASPTIHTPQSEQYRVTRVIDGDTIVVLIDGVEKTVRYIGIDTPETVHPTKPAGCFGVEASAKNKELLSSGYVRLVKDISETDKYGRLLRYVYVGDTFVNLALVEGGYANASTYPPDVAHTELFLTAEDAARSAQRGLWGAACAEYRENTTSGASIPTASTAGATPTGSCSIKGNISISGEKIFHVIGCDSYSKTVINESAGERWFCSEQEALNAGWRKALNC